MGTFLSQVTKGKVKKPHLILIYGQDKIGKSTFAAHAPASVFLPLEEGTSRLDVSRLPKPETFDQVLNILSELTTEKHPYQSLVVDSLDWLEPLIYDHVVKSANSPKIRSIEDFGYGAGYAKAVDEWKKFIAAIELLQSKTGMNVIFIAHPQIKSTNDPHLNANYDRYELKLYKGAAAKFREFVDAILFARFEIQIVQETDKKARAYGTGVRKLYTQYRPGFDAGNRLSLPFELELSWEAYEKAAKSSEARNAETLKAEIANYYEQLSDSNIKPKVMAAIEAAGNNEVQLEEVLNRLKEILTAK